MRVLVLGGGAREHALVARLAAEPGVARARRRAGQPRHGRAGAHSCPSTPRDPDGAARLAEREQIDFTDRRTRAAARARRRRSLSSTPAGCVFGPPPRPRGSSRARRSRRRSWRGTAFRPRASASATRSPRRAPSSRSRRARLSRRAEGGRSGRGQRRRRRRRSRRGRARRSAPRWRTRSSAPPASGS